jgi:hypothetical protein
MLAPALVMAGQQQGRGVATPVRSALIPPYACPSHRARLAPPSPAPLPPALPQLNEEGPADDDEGEDGVPSYRELPLPAAELAGQWEALHYDTAIKARLLTYAASALLFAERGVDANLVAWNRRVHVCLMRV